MAWEIIIVFGAPVAAYVAKRYFDAVEKGRVQVPTLAPANNKELVELRRTNKVLDERVKNLESIVCGLDFELNARLARLTPAGPRSLPPVTTTPPPAPLPPPPVDSRPATPTPVVPAASPASPAPVDPRFVETLVRTAPGSELAAGTLVAGRYRVERLLGRGGMGAVYLARDPTLGEQVALKVISGALLHDPATATERFRRETSAARRITHPNVIRIHDLGETDGVPYMSMEYFPGRTLAEHLRAGPLPLDDARRILDQTCAGLSAAHAAGVVHRDLKPANVLVGAQAMVKIIDFGLAKTTFLDGMTASGLIMGTPEYMSPEQVRGRPVDFRADIYALGAIAYHVVTGRPPFTADNPIAVGFAHCSETPRPPRELRSDVPAGLERAILAALAKEPAERPASVDEFCRALA